MQSFPTSTLFDAVNAKAESMREGRPTWMTFEQLQFRVLCAALEIGMRASIMTAESLDVTLMFLRVKP